MKVLAVFVLAFLAGSAYAIAQSSKSDQDKSSTGNAEAGKKSFEMRCSPCHGADGSGKTAIADSLGGIPDLHSKEVQMLTDDEIKKVITKGTDKMPPVSDVTDAEVADLIAFIRVLGAK